MCVCLWVYHFRVFMLSLISLFLCCLLLWCLAYLVSTVTSQEFGREESLRSDLCCVKWDAKPELTQSINQSLLLLYKSFPLKKPFFPQDHLGLGPDPLGSRFFLTRAICRYASTICCVRQCVRLSARVPVRSREFYENG